MHIKRHLNFTTLVNKIASRVSEISDYREQDRIDYSLCDCVMTGFAMMFFQDPSLAEFQRRLQKRVQQNNLKTLFNVEKIPKESQMRDVIDEISFRELDPVFKDYFLSLQRYKHLERYQFLNGYYLVSMDGTNYFGSEKIHCPSCLIREQTKGSIYYYHLIVQATLMHPDCRQVIPLSPEPAMNKDGNTKQDCELNAGKRLIDKIRRAHPRLKIIIVGDSLYSHQPFIEELRENNMRFILVAKPGDHKALMEWVKEIKEMGEMNRYELKDSKGRELIYEWINNVPINGKEKSIEVNYFEFWIKDNGKITYHNSWVTDFTIDKENVVELVRGGRSRWKIENECFNTLKNHGYHIEHNFGHGKKNLSMNFFLLNLLAFFIHQIFELTCLLYQRCRNEFGSRKEYWNALRNLIRFLIFRSWEELLKFILSPPEPESG